MNDHDTFEQYFADRAPHLDPAPAGVTAVARRGRARRHRRTGMRMAAVVGVLAVGGGIVAQGRSTGDDQQVDTQTAVPAKLAWTLVDAPKGIGGYGAEARAATSDGSIYQLSTGPLSTSPGPEANRRVLYRSTDDVTWTPAELPSGLSASALAADGDRLYALGTAPAGGGVGLRLAARDGGSAWTTSDVPLDLVGMGRTFPGRVFTSGFQLATAHGTTVVAVSVRGDIDPASLPADVDLDEDQGGWGTTPEGIDVYQSCAEEPASGETTTSVVGGTGPVEPASGVEDSCTEAVDGEPVVLRSYTWAQLGLTAEQAELANGRTYLYTSTDGGPLAQSGQLPDASWQATVLATDGGFWLARDVSTAEGYGTTSVLFSADGRDWTGAPIEVPGAVTSAGVLAGRPVVVTVADDGPDLVVLGAGGPQTTHLKTALGGEPDDFVSSSVAIGPLGVAFTFTSGMDDDGTGGRTEVVHSADGATFARQALPAAPAGKVERPNNVSVSADAIVVRLNSYPEGSTPDERGPRPTQRAFVGTPG